MFYYFDYKNKILMKIKGNSKILQSGWRKLLIDELNKIFKNYKLRIYKNIFCLYIPSKEMLKINKLEKKIKKIIETVKEKIYYDIYFI